MAENQGQLQANKAVPGLIKAANIDLSYWTGIGLICLQLILTSWLMRRYALEPNLMLASFMPYIAGGFLIQLFLPLKYRMTWFLALGAGAAFYLYGGIPGALLLGMILLLFGILRLPLKTRWRALLLAAAGLAIAWLWKFHPDMVPGGYRIFPILGSVFMFRASVYLYDTQHEKSPQPLLQQLAYFLLLPNLAISLFPVVDYKTFGRSWYQSDSLPVFQKGMRWIVRGFFHLMLYRILYYYVQPSLGEVEGVFSLSLYMVTSYMLIIRLSGIFHFSAGVLCLFGFNLPPVFHNYFFAESFSDLWRRINIYWRDYMMKVFYYPVYFKLRKLGTTSRTVISILIAFGITWMLHSYQWFWLQGSFPIRLIDGIFWGIFGITVAVSSVRQMNNSPKGKKNKNQSAGKRVFFRLLRISSLFVFMCILWTFWNSPSVSAWIELVVRAKYAPLSDWLLLAGIGMGIFLFAWLCFLAFEKPFIRRLLEPDDSKKTAIGWSLASLGIFLLLSFPGLLQPLQALTAKPVVHLYEARLNEDDDAQKLEAYYNDILIPNRISTFAAEQMGWPADWAPFSQTGASQRTGDWMGNKMLPNKSVLFKGKRLTTNQWGFRDQYYAKAKPDNTFRMALLGGSYVMGSGVHDSEVFDQICEQKLNADNPWDLRFEMLNFAVPSYHLLHQVKQFETSVTEFEPDAALFFTHGLDLNKSLQVVNSCYMDTMEVSLDFVGEIMQEAGFAPGQKISFDKTLFEKLNQDLVEAGYKRISEICKAQNISPVLVYWPRTRREANEENLDLIFELAQKHGFTILDLSNTWDGYKESELIIGQYDNHPNAKGQQIFGEKLYQGLLESEAIKQLIEQKSKQ
ncbi:MAG: hypothetical protein GYB31_02155 [Bacteroidetes bacterium]|nr:hypothetical protein [Bacteroidota bacterium]